MVILSFKKLNQANTGLTYQNFIQAQNLAEKKSEHVEKKLLNKFISNGKIIIN